MLKVISCVPYKWLKVIFLLPILIGMGACSKITLEDQFKGIINCEIYNIYLDPVTNEVSGRYFVERQLKPYLIDEAAFYYVKDTFYGLNVSEVSIPYVGPFSVHAIYFKENKEIVEAVLRKRFDDIKINQDDGVTPVLMADPKGRAGSILYCDQYSE